MALRNRMHPRNIYKIPPDFKELAIEFPEFRKYAKQELSGKVTINYNDPKAVSELTKTLLAKDFNLKVEIVETRLIPRVPLCLNYILWIEDLLSTLQVNDRQPSGIDIGTGSIGIYSLLAATKGWKMLATEVDESNVKLASDNVKLNDLTNDITIKFVEDPDKILLGVINAEYDFCMCNPPFFDHSEQFTSRNPDRPNPKSIASNVTSEISTSGGELAFVSKLMKESQVLKTKIKIYTTLVGKKTDFLKLKSEITKMSPLHSSVTEFCQGRTTRWGIAWTYLDINLKKADALGAKKKIKEKPALQHVFSKTKKTQTLKEALNLTEQLLSRLKLNYAAENVKGHTGFKVKAFENTWSHQRRNKRQKKIKTDTDEKPKKTTDDAIESDDNGCSEAKRPRLNNTSSQEILSEVSTVESTLIVEFYLLLREEGDLIVMELPCLAGNKESLHQILQYIKNNWESLKDCDLEI